MPGIIDPFPLNIGPKQDSWDKLQLLLFLDPSLKVTAAELNKIVDALNYLHGNVTVGGYSGNVPLDLKSVIIDYNAPGATATKVAAAINALPNYTLKNGYAQWFQSRRSVLTNGPGISVSGWPAYAIITEYFLLNKKIAPLGGVASVGVGGTQINSGDLIALPPKDTRSFAAQEFDLGNIASASIWTAVSASTDRSTPNTATIIFKANQGGTDKAWLYLGDQENVGASYPVLHSSDFRLLPADGIGADPPPPPLTRIYKKYGTIAEMLLRQVEQTGNELIIVDDAIGDENITFAEGETKRQASYFFNATADTRPGSINDYTLFSAPYGNHTRGGGTDSGLELGTTATTAHRGDHGAHAYDSIIEAEQYDFAARLTSNLDF